VTVSPCGSKGATGARAASTKWKEANRRVRHGPGSLDSGTRRADPQLADLVGARRFELPTPCTPCRWIVDATLGFYLESARALLTFTAGLGRLRIHSGRPS
jgi:hypothetical protein